VLHGRYDVSWRQIWHLVRGYVLLLVLWSISGIAVCYLVDADRGWGDGRELKGGAILAVAWVVGLCATIACRGRRSSIALSYTLIVSSLCVQVVVGRWVRSPPKDDVMIRAFRANEERLEELVRLVQRDMIAGGRIGHPFRVVRSENENENDSDTLLGWQRAEYLRLLQDIGALQISGFYPDGPLMCVMWSRGLFNHGQTKGYLHTSSVPQGFMQVDDTANSSVRGVTYRHIRGKWYIFYSMS
jgi:hypothetical protein